MPRRGARRWIGIDGEGIGRKPHRYVMLCASDGEGRAELLEDKRGLGTARCLDFLLAWATRDVRLCGYYLSYDWTMILRDLPNAAIYRLMRPELRALPKGEGGGFSPVRWREYRLHWLAGMMRVSRGSRSVTIWDLGRYFQTPFVDACDKWKILPEDELARMRAMKKRRASFSLHDLPAVRTYNREECSALARLAAELEKAHADADLTPRGWYGPGATASVLLSRARIDERRGDIPREVEEVASRAFFGGRFEQRTLGRHRVKGWDIASAYPYAAFELPCLEHGRWERVTRERDALRARHACVRWELSDTGAVPWGPLPVRLQRGAIVFPRSGASGWVWRDEYQAARHAWRGVRWGGEAWALRCDCDCRPFEFILDAYRARLALGKGTRGIPIKLGCNSCYGKLAQAIGGGGPFTSRVWAGMITSTTRAMLLGAIASHHDRRDVIAVATDGLYTCDESWQAPDAPLAPDTLGSWEESAPQDIVFLRPGIYAGPSTVRARGVGRALLAERAERLNLHRAHVKLGKRSAFGSARQCVRLSRGRYVRDATYGEWRDLAVKVALTPAPKRASDWQLLALDDVESLPYSRQTASHASPLAEFLVNSAEL